MSSKEDSTFIMPSSDDGREEQRNAFLQFSSPQIALRTPQHREGNANYFLPDEGEDYTYNDQENESVSHHAESFELSQAGVAVLATDLCRSYGSGSSKRYILRNFNMTVNKGTIYGLLGASGCGKTTFLKTLIGRLRIHGGELKVLGRSPLSKGHRIPGRLVGYMPQEIALYNELTCYESLKFFARLFHMDMAIFEERCAFLLDLLGIAFQKHQLVKTLSGGQKRRLSLAVALLHRPQLCILDEPTVGVDPVLRAKIWQYLVEFVKETACTIIITTHYIEEARQADRVGLMRDGHLLAEDAPEALLRKYSSPSLEDVFLKLCIAKDQSEEEAHRKGFHTKQDGEGGFARLVRRLCPSFSSSSSKGLSVQSEDQAPLIRQHVLSRPFKKPPEPFQRPKFRNVASLAWKNFTRYRRNYPFLAIQLLLPAIQVILFCLAIGRPPVHLPIAIVNEDQPYLGALYSHNFTSFLDGKTFIQHEYQSLGEARDRVREGAMWGIIYFNANFTADLYRRYTDPAFIEGSKVKLYLDNTDQQVSIAIQEKCDIAGLLLSEYVLSTLGLSPSMASSAVELETPIYGDSAPSFTDFVAPGILPSIIFLQSIALSALAFVVDNREGILDRIWSTGVRPSELLLSQIASEILIIGTQACLMLVFARFVFSVPLVGNLALVALALIFLGLTGMTFGLVISTIVSTESEAVQLSMGVVFPSLLLSGVLWPQSAIPNGLLQLSYTLPTSWGATVLRSLMLRGWGFAQEEVWLGFAILFAWEVFALILAAWRVRNVE